MLDLRITVYHDINACKKQFDEIFLVLLLSMEIGF
jgi:hypothetical protein